MAAARPAFLSNNSATGRRREPSFPSPQTRGSSSLAGAPSPSLSTGAWGLPSPSAESPGASPALSNSRKKGPSLSLAMSGKTEATVHPLKHHYEASFSHRSAPVNSSGKNGKREEWEGGVVKLGGFSSIESLHPFLAHLTNPSALPASISSSATLFASDSSEPPPAPSNVISDINIFRSPIAALWEDPANVGGGRWVLRLRKGVADRVWEEVVFALVGERLGGEDDAEDKVNGIVLSVRKDEDIMSIWCAPTSRPERDSIRDSLRAALEPILTPTSLANLALDYKPHPVAGAGGAQNASAGGASSRTNEGTPHREHSHRDREGHGQGRHDHGHHGRERSEHNGGRSERGERSARVGGFGSYNRARGEGEERPSGEYRERERTDSHRDRESSGTASSGLLGRNGRGNTEAKERPASNGWGRI